MPLLLHSGKSDLRGACSIPPVAKKGLNRRANATSVPVSVTASQIIYKYNPLNLVVSYALALSFASFSADLGFYAFRTNGRHAHDGLLVRHRDDA